MIVFFFKFLKGRWKGQFFWFCNGRTAPRTISRARRPLQVIFKARFKEASWIMMAFFIFESGRNELYEPLVRKMFKTDVGKREFQVQMQDISEGRHCFVRDTSQDCHDFWRQGSSSTESKWMCNLKSRQERGTDEDLGRGAYGCWVVFT